MCLCARVYVRGRQVEGCSRERGGGSSGKRGDDHKNGEGVKRVIPPSRKVHPTCQMIPIDVVFKKKKIFFNYTDDPG